MTLKLFIGFAFFILLHVLAWFSTNLQFFNGEIAKKSLQIAIALSIPTTVAAYYASKFTYEGLGGTAWGARFVSFGTSYLIFPFLTWWLLKEPTFTPKTMICIALSITIILIQVFWK